MFKKGDRVVIAVGSQYHGNKNTDSNNPMCEGTVREVFDENRYQTHPVKVDWDNGEYNAYREYDLSLVGTIKEVKVAKVNENRNRKITLIYKDGSTFHFTRVKGLIIDTRSDQVKIDNTKTIDLITINNNTLIPFSYLDAVLYEDPATEKRFAYFFEDGKVVSKQESFAKGEVLSVQQH